MNIDNMQKVLLECSKNLGYPKIQDDWNDNNKCFGMCAITSLVINDYFGGDICKIHVDGISHYFNLVVDKIIDRFKILTDDTRHRYNILKAKLIKALLKQIDEKYIFVNLVIT